MDKIKDKIKDKIEYQKFETHNLQRILRKLGGSNFKPLCSNELIEVFRYDRQIENLILIKKYQYPNVVELSGNVDNIFPSLKKYLTKLNN